MKKALSIILAAILLLSCLPLGALAEGVTIIGESGAFADVSDLSDMKVDEPIDLGDYVITLTKASIEDGKLIMVINVFNYLPKTVSFFKDAKVLVTYVGERAEYKFDGYGCYRVNSFGNVYWQSGDPTITVGQLSQNLARFECALPTFVIENEGELKMEVSYNNMVFTYYFRR